MKTKILTLGLAVAMSGAVIAQFNPIPLTPGSFTKDVIVEKTAPIPAQMRVTANMDAGTNIAGLTAGGGNGGNQGSFIEKGAGTTAGVGLPYHGSIFTAFFNNPAGTVHKYQMAPDYTQPNALFIGGAGTVPQQVTSGTFTLPPGSPLYTHLSVLSSAGTGPVGAQVSITYVDGSQEQQVIFIPDWFLTNNPSGTVNVTNNTAFICNGDFQGSDGSYQNVNVNAGGAPLYNQRIRLYYQDITLGSALTVSNVTFTYSSGGRAAIFGLSGSTDGGVNFNPIAVTGYTYDMVIEAPLPDTVTATMDQGTNKTGTTWFELGYNYANPAGTFNTGLPHPGTTFQALSNASYTFTMPASYTNNNSLLIANQTGFTTAGLTLATPAPYAAISLFETAGNGPESNSYVVTYVDGSTQVGTNLIPDWFNNTVTNVALLAKGRVQVDQLNNVNSSGTLTGTKFFYDNIVLTNTTTAVSNITFTYLGGGRSCTMAVSGDTTGSGTFSPIAVTGLNADMVVEASVVTNVNFRSYTTATMDGGTNNNANTWYEQGWNKLEPLSGLPAAGSSITSAVLPDHHYQMAPSYSLPNAIYADSNNPVANITFQTPSNYSAVSFLSANANGGIKIKVILNHDDGSSETNSFDSLDWFNGANPAFTSAGRMNSDSRSANNYIPTSTNPRLYEAQFSLQDTVHKVTGATLIWTTNASSTTTNFASATSRFVVLAVSGAFGSVAPIIGISPISTNLYENTGFTIAATVSGGSAPITNHWQKSSIGGTTWTNVVDGGDISGSTTTNLTFVHPSWTNTGDYRLLAANIAGSTPTLTATVQVFSALPDIDTNSDSLTEFGNSIADPAAETFNHAIDGLVGTDPAKWLTFGLNGGAPFAGPVGFTVTPQIGNTIAQAVRLFTANDSEQRDPIDFMLEGSIDGGNSWATIVSSPLALPATRNAAASAPKNPLIQAVQEVHWVNTNGYTTYRVSFSNVKNNVAAATCMQIGEIELLGTQTPVPPFISRQPVPVVTVYKGASPNFSVKASGPPPVTYQWVRAGSGAIPGETNSSYTLHNAQLSDEGAVFSCTVSDPYGPTVSSSTLLHVIAPPTNAYPSLVITDGPVAFWRLDEADDLNGNSGAAANDYLGGHTGIYTNVQLALPGYNTNDSDTAAGFATFTIPSYVGSINGLDFATPTNTSGNLSVEAWVRSSSGQPAGAGIIALGIGGSGEEFALDCGAGSSAYRFYFRDAAGGSHPINSAVGNPVNSSDGLWHHLVGVVNETATNEVFYIDGLAVGTNALAPGLGILKQANVIPLTIGARSGGTATPTLQFAGLIDEVAVYNYALTSAQVQNHYLTAGIAPSFLIAPSNVVASEGTTATFTSTPYGSPTLKVQWYNSDGSNPTTALSGQTNNSFSLANVSSAQDGKNYQLVVTNNYGALTSSPVTLFVVSGPPQILTDLQSTYSFFGGSQITLSVNAGGTPPLSYFWTFNGSNVSNGGRISGATTSTLKIANAQPSDAGQYQVIVSNNFSTAAGGFAQVSVTPSLGFDNGATWTIQGLGGIYLSSNVVQLTDGGGSEGSSTFYKAPVYIGSFQASFTYQDVGAGTADGAAFVLQNDPRGAAALGGAGGGLGYSGITPSVAVEFNIYSPNTVGYAFRANGATGAPYASTPPLNIGSGNPIDVVITYINGVLTMSLTDNGAGTKFTTNAAFNLPAILGANTAFVGVTGADGGQVSTQQVSNFKFIGLSGLQAQISGNNLVFSWPVGTGSYVVQSAPSASGPWADLNAAITVSNGQNQITVPNSGGTAFYRLHIQIP